MFFCWTPLEVHQRHHHLARNWNGFQTEPLKVSSFQQESATSSLNPSCCIRTILGMICSKYWQIMDVSSEHSNTRPTTCLLLLCDCLHSLEADYTNHQSLFHLFWRINHFSSIFFHNQVCILFVDSRAWGCYTGDHTRRGPGSSHKSWEKASSCWHYWAVEQYLWDWGSCEALYCHTLHDIMHTDARNHCIVHSVHPLLTLAGVPTFVLPAAEHHMHARIRIYRKVITVRKSESSHFSGYFSVQLHAHRQNT